MNAAQRPFELDAGTEDVLFLEGGGLFLEGGGPPVSPGGFGNSGAIWTRLNAW
jgi:hypothetical protein